MRFFLKLVICLIIFVSFFTLYYTLYESSRPGFIFNHIKHNVSFGDEIKSLLQGRSRFAASMNLRPSSSKYEKDIYNVWCIFTRVHSNAPLKLKFKAFLKSLLEHSNARLRLNLISDNTSLPIAEEILHSVKKSTGKDLKFSYHNVLDCARVAADIVQAMTPHFSSQPGTYYSDVLFFLSLGLHRIAKNQERAVIFDADIVLVTDVTEIFSEFEKFGPEALFGLAAEQSPVYRHVLYTYRLHHPGTVFGTPLSRGGVPGVNSGVLLLNLERMRQSKKYRTILTQKAVAELTQRYSFKGHLGDQDLYTLLSMDSPSLIHMLPCEWNRQLCTWWRDHGYRDIFEEFHRCDNPVKAYHGNCNTQIPVAKQIL